MNDKVEDDYNVADRMDLPVPTTIEEAIHQRNGWVNTAAFHSRNEQYYRGLLKQIGAILGPEAYTANDGSVYDEVLCIKLPDLVRKHVWREYEKVANVDQLLKVAQVGIKRNANIILNEMYYSDFMNSRAKAYFDPTTEKYYVGRLYGLKIACEKFDADIYAYIVYPKE